MPVSKLLTLPIGSYLMVRLDYVIICGNDELEAKILRLIEMYMEDERRRLYQDMLNDPKVEIKPDQIIEITKDVWASISHRLFMNDLYGLVKSENTVKRAINSLIKKKFIHMQTGTGKYEAPRYQIDTEVVQAELDKLATLGKSGYQKLIPSNADTIKNSYHQPLTPSGYQKLIPSGQNRVSKVDTNSNKGNYEKKDTVERITSSPSLDVDAHASDVLHETVEGHIEQLDGHLTEEHPTVATALFQDEQGADDDGQRTHIAPILQHGGAASANPLGGSRAPEGKTKRKTQQQNGTQEDAPVPKCDTKEIQKRINAHRGYALEEKVAIIRERDAIKSWCNLHPLEDYDRVMKRLKNDPYWGKEENYRRIGGRQLLTETPRILAELAQEQERPPQEKTMSGLPRLVPLGVKL